MELRAVGEHVAEQDASTEVDPAHDAAASRDHHVRHVVEEGQAWRWSLEFELQHFGGPLPLS